MNYELAKQLKEAGFEQKSLPHYCNECHQIQWSDAQLDLCDHHGADWTYIPFLSELIEACGFGFRSLSLHSDGRWIAKSGANTGKFLKNGKTPESAVAKLWLELNK